MGENQGAGGTCKGMITMRGHGLRARQGREEEISNLKVTGPIVWQPPKSWRIGGQGGLWYSNVGRTRVVDREWGV